MGMSVALTVQNKRTLKRLLSTGRWGNESEILRYGLHLVEQEVQAKAHDQLPAPIPNKVMARIYREETPEEKAIEAKLSKASSRLTPEDDE